MNVDEKEKAALCIAVHHRQYPCFFSIHIHTPFSYPQQEQGGKSANVFESTAMEDFSQKETVRRYSVHTHTHTCANRVLEGGQERENIERMRWQGRCFLDVFIPNHFDLCETAASLMKKEAEKKNPKPVCDQISSARMFPLSPPEMYPGAFKGF